MKKFLLILLTLPTNLIQSENIIFDLYGVIFNIPYTVAIKQYNLSDMAGYTLIDWQNPMKFDSRFTDCLLEVPVPVEFKKYLPKVMTAQTLNKNMAPILYLWQTGKINYRETLELVVKHMDSLNISDREKRMLKNTAHICFDLETRKQCFKPIPAGVSILKQCAAELKADGTKKHKLFVLSNMDKEIIEFLIQTYPEIFDLFDGIVYSGQTGSLKPERDIYITLLDKYKLDPKDSIFIDDQQENIVAAEELGITGILCKNFKVTRQELIDKKVITEKLSAAVINLKTVLAITTIVALTATIINLKY